MVLAFPESQTLSFFEKPIVSYTVCPADSNGTLDRVFCVTPVLGCVHTCPQSIHSAVAQAQEAFWRFPAVVSWGFAKMCVVCGAGRGGAVHWRSRSAQLYSSHLPQPKQPHDCSRCRAVATVLILFLWCLETSLESHFFTPHQGARFLSGSCTMVVIEFLCGALMVHEKNGCVKWTVWSEKWASLCSVWLAVWFADLCNHFSDISWNKPLCNKIYTSNDSDWKKP